jgi:hypothetical protein
MELYLQYPICLHGKTLNEAQAFITVHKSSHMLSLYLDILNAPRCPNGIHENFNNIQYSFQLN